MENRKFQSLWEALEEVQDNVEGGNYLTAFGLDISIFLTEWYAEFASGFTRLCKSWHAISFAYHRDPNNAAISLFSPKNNVGYSNLNNILEKYDATRLDFPGFSRLNTLNIIFFLFITRVQDIPMARHNINYASVSCPVIVLSPGNCAHQEHRFNNVSSEKRFRIKWFLKSIESQVLTALEGK